MILFNCDINLILTWASTCVITSSTGEQTFVITVTKLYVALVTLSTQNNAKLLEQLKLCFKKEQLTEIDIYQKTRQKDTIHI